MGRGGEKLKLAIDRIGLDLTGKVGADFGCNVGGFTDCMLQEGAVRVYAVDTGYGMLAWKLRQDPRVTSIERTNVRTLQALPGNALADLAVIDVSFIGLELVLPIVDRFLQPAGHIIALIKPQFEAGRGQVGKGGVVKDPAVHRQVLERVLGWAIRHGWLVGGLVRSPITGPKGNVEFLCLLVHGQSEHRVELDDLIGQVLSTGEDAPSSGP